MKAIHLSNEREAVIMNVSDVVLRHFLLTVLSPEADGIITLT